MLSRFCFAAIHHGIIRCFYMTPCQDIKLTANRLNREGEAVSRAHVSAPLVERTQLSWQLHWSWSTRRHLCVSPDIWSFQCWSIFDFPRFLCLCIEQSTFPEEDLWRTCRSAFIKSHCSSWCIRLINSWRSVPEVIWYISDELWLILHEEL